MTDNAGEIEANLQREDISLQAARDMIEKGYYDIAASRAYYAAFYSASALLLKQNIDTSKHSGVIASIHHLFVKNGKLDKEQGKISIGYLSFVVLETMELQNTFRLDKRTKRYR